MLICKPKHSATLHFSFFLFVLFYKIGEVQNVNPHITQRHLKLRQKEYNISRANLYELE
jgi:hypothetical protein